MEKAAETCIPSEWLLDAEKPVACQQLDYRDGWLTDLNLRENASSEPAAYSDYTGDKTKTNRHIDGKLARATLACYGDELTKKVLFITWTDSFWIDAGTAFSSPSRTGWPMVRRLRCIRSAPSLDFSMRNAG